MPLARDNAAVRRSAVVAREIQSKNAGELPALRNGGGVGCKRFQKKNKIKFVK
jgi:hypothetical protein